MSGTRESESRAATQRAALSDKPRLRLDVDMTGLPEDMEAVWVRETEGGAYAEGNVEDALYRGLVPATTETLPMARRALTLPGREPPKDNLIRRGDMVLMVGPKRGMEAERAIHASRVQQQIASVERVGNDSGAQLDGENFVEASRVSSRVERVEGKAPPLKSKFPD